MKTIESPWLRLVECAGRPISWVDPRRREWVCYEALEELLEDKEVPLHARPSETGVMEIRFALSAERPTEGPCVELEVTGGFGDVEVEGHVLYPGPSRAIVQALDCDEPTAIRRDLWLTWEKRPRRPVFYTEEIGRAVLDLDDEGLMGVLRAIHDRRAKPRGTAPGRWIEAEVDRFCLIHYCEE